MARPAVLCDVVIELLRAFDLADDGRAGIFLQDEAGKEEQELVSPEDISAIGDHADPVGVSVVGDTCVGLLFRTRRVNSRRFSGRVGSGKWLGKRPSGSQ